MFTCENQKATPGLIMVVSETRDHINPWKVYSYWLWDDFANQY